MFQFDFPPFRELCERKFHPGTRAKGAEIHASGKVLSCQVEEERMECGIFATVQSGSGAPYEVEITCGLYQNKPFWTRSVLVRWRSIASTFMRFC